MLVCFVVVVYLICPRIYMVGIVINCTEQIKKLRLREKDLPEATSCPTGKAGNPPRQSHSGSALSSYT